jgi:hypothetical protein
MECRVHDECDAGLCSGGRMTAAQHVVKDDELSAATGLSWDCSVSISRGVFQPLQG